jgi:hypothetical protein
VSIHVCIHTYTYTFTAGCKYVTDVSLSPLVTHGAEDAGGGRGGVVTHWGGARGVGGDRRETPRDICGLRALSLRACRRVLCVCLCVCVCVCVCVFVCVCVSYILCVVFYIVCVVRVCVCVCVCVCVYCLYVARLIGMSVLCERSVAALLQLCCISVAALLHVCFRGCSARPTAAAL